MKRTFEIVLAVLVFLLMSSFLGCHTQSRPDTPSNTTKASLYWIEIEGRFFTNDLARAQSESPVPIILPTYIPDKRQDTLLPDIDGPLYNASNTRIEINAKYLIYLGSEIPAIILIKETNDHISLGDPKLNSDLETIQIDCIPVIKTRPNSEAISDTWFSFNYRDIYFVIEMHDIPSEEQVKIVESMIKQLQ